MGGLVVAFFGYRLYIACLACLGFLIFMTLEGVNGSIWIANDPDKEVQKKLIVAAFCLMWGAMGAWLVPKLVGKFQRFLGFLLGAVVGVVVVAGLTWASSGIVNRIHSGLSEGDTDPYI